jgi:hypothetical protein
MNGMMAGSSTSRLRVPDQPILGQYLIRCRPGISSSRAVQIPISGARLTDWLVARG